MKHLLTFAFVVLSLSSFACGGYWSFEMTYYHLFDQKRMVSPSYLPFIYYADGLFYEDYKSQPWVDNRNLNDWKVHFNNRLSTEQLYNLIVKAPLSEVEKATIPRKQKSKFIEYLRLARKVDGVTKISYDEAWDPTLKAKNNQQFISELIDMYKSADEFYKVRYLYQWSKLNLSTQDLFDFETMHELAKDVDNKDAVYHYLQSNLAYFEKNTKDSLQAGATYLKTFVEVPEKRLNAYNSLRFTLQQESYDLLLPLLNNDEKQALEFIKGFEGEQTPTETLQAMVKYGKNAEITNLALARALNYELRITYKDQIMSVNHITCSNHKAYKAFKADDVYDFYNYREENSNLSGLKQIIETTINNSINDVDRWELALAQVEFLQGNQRESERLVNKLTKSKQKDIQNQALLLSYFNEVNAMKRIGNKQESELQNILSKIEAVVKETNPNTEDEDYIWYNEEVNFAYDSVEMFWKILSQKYYDQGDYAKSFLSVSDVSSLYTYRDRCVLEDLLTMIEAKKQNEFEKTLVKRFDHEHPDLVLQDLLATTYVYDFKYDEALEIYETINKNASRKVQESILYYTNLPKEIFASTYRQCYECKFSTNITNVQPKPVEYGAFANKYDLIKKVNELRKSPKPEDQLAYGNFLLNINRKGYFRHYFSYAESQGTNAHFSPEVTEYGWEHVLPISYPETKKVFEFVIQSNSASYEQKAMATWGIIQATQGEIEDEGTPSLKRLDDEFDWELDNFVSLYVTDEKMKQAYNRLDAYANTKFAQEIIKECGYYQFSRTLN